METVSNFEDKKVKEVWTKYSDYSKKRWDAFEERHAKWTEKVKDFFVYSIGWNLRYWWHDMKWFFRNIWKFIKLAYHWRPWDYNYQIDLFKFGLGELADFMDRFGNEVDETRTKKVAAIRELLAELGKDYKDDVETDDPFGDNIEKIVEYEDGSVAFSFKEDEETKEKEKAHEEAVEAARKAHYEKIFRLLIGQDMKVLHDEVTKRFKELNEDDPHYTRRSKIFAELYDGSGIEGWWD